MGLRYALQINFYSKMTAPYYISAISALAIFAGCSGGENKDTAHSQQPTVDVAFPETDSVVLYKTYPGHLSANKEVDLVARVDGYLTSSPYKSGALVRKGQVLFTIDDKQYRDAVTQAQAALETARATNAYARQHYEAVQKALKADAVSQMEVIQAKSAYENSEAQIRNAEASLHSAQTTLGYCTVRAPFDGHITDGIYNDGAFLAGAASPVVLATIFDDAVMTAIFSIEDSRYLDIINVNHDSIGVDFSRMPVRFSEELPHSYTADLTYMSPSVNANTGTMTIKAKIRNVHNELKSGMYFTIDLPYATDAHAILVKDAAIGSDQRGKYLYVVNDSCKVVYTPVVTGGLVADTMRIVTSGIGPDDRYITKAMLKVRPGMAVTPVTTK